MLNLIRLGVVLRLTRAVTLVASTEANHSAITVWPQYEHGTGTGRDTVKALYGTQWGTVWMPWNLGNYAWRNFSSARMDGGGINITPGVIRISP